MEYSGHNLKNDKHIATQGKNLYERKVDDKNDNDGKNDADGAINRVICCWITYM